MRKSIVTVLAALATSAAFVSPAAAKTGETQIIVTYSDLDLADPAGSAELDKRIEVAVDHVCEKPDIRNIKGMVAWEECKTTAKGSALEQVSVLEPYESMALVSIF